MRKIIVLVLLFSVLGSLKVDAQDRVTENVFFITLDGLRWQGLYGGIDEKLMVHEDYVRNSDALREQFWADSAEERREKLMPFFWSTIVGEGQLYGNRDLNNRVDVTNGRNFSYPGYNEILTGFADDNVDSNAKIWNANKTVLEFVNEQPAYRGSVAAFASWDVFPYIINSERSGIPVNAAFEPVEHQNLTEREKLLNQLLFEIPGPWGGVRLDAFTHYFALEYAIKYQPNLLYIGYGETDDFAHDGNYEAYIKSARQTDQFISDLWDFVQKHPAYRNKTTFVITTDHGRGTEPIDTWRSHGSNIEGAEEIWIAVIGPDTPHLGEVSEEGQLYQNQVASTVARFLGLNYQNRVTPGEWIRSAFR